MASEQTPDLVAFLQQILDRLSAIEARLGDVTASGPGLPPAPAGDPLPFWTRVSGPMGDIAQPYLPAARDYDEARNRARWGYTHAGTRACWGAGLDAAWAEVAKIKRLTPETVLTYRRGIYSVLDPDFACFGVMTGLIPVTEEPFRNIDTTQYAGMTVQSYLDAQFGIEGGPSGAPV